ncbi:MAG: Smr/MutS family protein [Bacilli bacterium]
MDDIFINNYPSIDIHGVDSKTAVYLCKNFIEDNLILKNKYIVVIHGKGQGILRKEIHKYLNRDKCVKSYKLNGFNIGITIIELIL